MMARPSSFDPMFEEVLRAAQAGAGWAFARLNQSLAPAVAGYLRAQGADDPEDLTSEVFIKVLLGCGSFAGGESQFRSWVFSVAHSRLVDARRAKTRTHDVHPLDDASVHDDGGSTSAAAEDEALGRLATERATELLGRLSPDQRDVLALRLISQMSVDEVAVVLGKPPGAVKALQRRALATLRRRMGDRHSIP
jgi:RNA polymerase sigma factor (sigma-70 family)